LEKSAVGHLLGWQPKMSSGALAAQLTQLKGSCDEIAITKLPASSQDHYQPSQKLEALDLPRVSTARISDNWWIASYSALQTEHKTLIQGIDMDLSSAPETARDDKQSDETDTAAGSLTTALTGIHSVLRGAGPGVLIHDLLEQCAQHGFKVMLATPDLRQQLIDRIFTPKAWDDKRDIIAKALAQWLTMPLLAVANSSLADLNIDRPRLLPAQVNGLLKGFIDLVFVHNQKYYVADYKFNALGNNDAAYTAEAMETAMLAKRYDLQYALYLLALHRLLKTRLSATYNYDTYIGGGLYLFLRGINGPSGGRVFDKPPNALIEGLDSLFSGSTSNGEIS
jgi:exodeoxyribonuclease V beta subunit